MNMSILNQYDLSPISQPHSQALVGASLILAILAYAGTDHGKGNDGYNNGKQNGRDKIHSVPEGGPGIVLSIATIGAVLLFSRRRLFRTVSN
jgi:hypothetical protein